MVGAGPAGSIAALVLARGGARVALADKAAFPRDKACGDLVGPRGVQVLAELGVGVPDAGQGATCSRSARPGGPAGSPRSRAGAMRVTGSWCRGWSSTTPCARRPSRRGRSRSRPGSARWTHGDRCPGGRRGRRAASGRRRCHRRGRRAEPGRTPGRDARPGTALWGFAIRAYLPAEVPLPLLVLLDAGPWRIFPGYGWLFPGADGQANVGIGVGLGTTRRQAPPRGNWPLLRAAAPSRRHRPGGSRGRSPAAGCGWAAPARRRPRATCCWSATRPAWSTRCRGRGSRRRWSAPGCGPGRPGRPGRPGPAYTEAVAAAFGGYMPGAAALQTVLLRARPASAGVRLLTAPAVRSLVAGTWSLYCNGLVDGARPRPSAWSAGLVQRPGGAARRQRPPVTPARRGVHAVPTTDGHRPPVMPCVEVHAVPAGDDGTRLPVTPARLRSSCGARRRNRCER